MKEEVPMTGPVVFVHGFATSHQRTWVDNGWVDLVGDAGREVLGIDLLGHGTAPKPHDPGAYADLTGWLLDTLPGGPLDIVAFSLGARLVLDAATHEPDRFARIVVAGVGANLFRDDRSDVIARAMRGETDTPDPIVRYFARLGEDPEADREALALVIEAPHEPLTAEKLAAVTCPVLVVLGDKDFAGPADPLVEALPDATHRELSGVDHFSTPKDFGFIDATLDFLGLDF